MPRAARREMAESAVSRGAAVRVRCEQDRRRGGHELDRAEGPGQGSAPDFESTECDAVDHGQVRAASRDHAARRQPRATEPVELDRGEAVRAEALGRAGRQDDAVVSRGAAAQELRRVGADHANARVGEQRADRVAAGADRGPEDDRVKRDAGHRFDRVLERLGQEPAGQGADDEGTARRRVGEQAEVRQQFVGLGGREGELGRDRAVEEHGSVVAAAEGDCLAVGRVTHREHFLAGPVRGPGPALETGAEHGQCRQGERERDR